MLHSRLEELLRLPTPPARCGATTATSPPPLNPALVAKLQQLQHQGLIDADNLDGLLRYSLASLFEEQEHLHQDIEAVRGAIAHPVTRMQKLLPAYDIAHKLAKSISTEVILLGGVRSQRKSTRRSGRRSPGSYGKRKVK